MAKKGFIRPARGTDPDTSAEAGKFVNEAHCALALEIYRKHPEGLAAYQVGIEMNLGQESCWWHRLSDLREAGYTEWVYHDNGAPMRKVNPTTNRSQRVAQITPLGRSGVWPPNRVAAEKKKSD